MGGGLGGMAHPGLAGLGGLGEGMPRPQMHGHQGVRIPALASPDFPGHLSGTRNLRPRPATLENAGACGNESRGAPRRCRGEGSPGGACTDFRPTSDRAGVVSFSILERPSSEIFPLEPCPAPPRPDPVPFRSSNALPRALCTFSLHLQCTSTPHAASPPPRLSSAGVLFVSSHRQRHAGIRNGKPAPV